MSLEDVKEGRYPCKIVNYGLKHNEHVGKIECLIQVKFKDGGDYHHITWKGFFTKKEGETNQKTVDTLITCGFATNDPTVLAEGPDGKHLDVDKVFDATLEKNEGGYLEVVWINEPGGTVFQDQLSKGEAVTQMKGINLGGDFMRAREGQGKKAEPAAKGQDFGPEPSFDSNDEIPF